MMRYLATFLMLAACAKSPAKPSASAEASDLEPIYKAKLVAYSVPASWLDWPSITDCDGTVWAGTAALADVDVGITLAEWSSGEIHRRPQISGECYPAGSSSTVSRDDIVLYMAAAFYQQNMPALQRLQAYANANDDWMGEPHDPNLTLMTPTLIGILSRALGGTGIDIEAPGVKDYQDNIEVEEILLSTAVNGGKANGWELALLDSLNDQYPSDALFEAAKGVYSGDCTTASDLLLANPITWPDYLSCDELANCQTAWWLRAAHLVLSHCS